MNMAAVSPTGRHDDVRRGRSLSLEPDLSTPIDSGNTLEASSHLHRPRTPSLFHVEVCPDSQSLEEGGISQEWFADVMKLVIDDLNEYGVCAVDGFLGAERAEQIFNEVGALHSQGVFRDGQVVSRQVQGQARGMIRGDKITWVTGGEPNCSGIGQLVSVVDSLVAKANKHQDAGQLADYNITWRTRAMVACYPGNDTHYVKHVDNPNGDGRCITAIYYVNKAWTREDGGVLRIYPEGCSDKVAEIEPLFDRMLFFWSDRRNPHEVLPAKITRYAITVWYLDQKEREDYLARVHNTSTNT
ncbi:prolyl hydroxylase EGLN3 isoform X2 [Panulirus ornatus]|uniref:prolyl hydroxylase EGLN3 isoform X2 n=1 Tax=Panulirus ornatus TaxID=150431 RepID=UPI003A8B1D4B